METKAKNADNYPFLLGYLWHNKSIRNWWISGFAVSLLQLIIFKFQYPFANYMPDSYSYLEAAYNNVDVSTWPVAYSKFLRLISVFTHSDKILVGLQYFLLQTSSFLFLFSLLYFIKPGKKINIILLVFFFLNPLPLYIANYISADSLFITLSLLWLTTLVWIIYHPRSVLILIHGMLLLACFTVRYNAIYYPLLSIISFVSSRQSWKLKTSGIILGFILVLSSILYTSQKMQKVTGIRQFSAFGGWQLANNALYMYEHVPPTKRVPVPQRFAQLDLMVREHMDTLKKVKFTQDDSVNTFFYLWSDKGPLVQYLVRQYKKDSVTPYFKRWASEGPLYADYATYLIRKFPQQFAVSFLLPNAVKYAVPPAEFLGIYNMGADSVSQLAKDWFNYKSLKVQDHKKKSSLVVVTAWYPLFSAIVNIVFILSLISLLILLKAILWKDYGLPQFLALAFAFWLFNMGFSIFASPIVLRYQLFPLYLFFPLAIILITRIYKMASANENN